MASHHVRCYISELFSHLLYFLNYISFTLFLLYLRLGYRASTTKRSNYHVRWIKLACAIDQTSRIWIIKPLIRVIGIAALACPLARVRHIGHGVFTSLSSAGKLFSSVYNGGKTTSPLWCFRPTCASLGSQVDSTNPWRAGWARTMSGFSAALPL